MHFDSYEMIKLSFYRQRLCCESICIFRVHGLGSLEKVCLVKSEQKAQAELVNAMSKNWTRQ
jgi:hypothetical protein